MGRYGEARPALGIDGENSLVSTRSVFDRRAVVVSQTRDEICWLGRLGVVSGRRLG